MITTTCHELVRYVRDLNDEELKEYTPMRIYDIVEMYELDSNRSVILKENLSYRTDSLYALHSPLEQRYYLRRTREYPEGEKALENLSGHVQRGNLYLLLSPQEVTAMKETLLRVGKHYTKKDKPLDYRKQYIPLIRAILDRDEYRRFGKRDDNYKTRMKQYDDTIKQLLKL